MSKLYKVDTSIENRVKDKSHMFFEEVKEGLFYLVKHRMSAERFYGSLSEIASYLNTDKTVGVRFLDGDIIYNQKVPLKRDEAERFNLLVETEEK